MQPRTQNQGFPIHVVFAHGTRRGLANIKLCVGVSGHDPKRYDTEKESGGRDGLEFKNFYAVRRFFRCMIPSKPTPPTAIIDQGEGSGTALVESVTLSRILPIF